MKRKSIKTVILIPLLITLVVGIAGMAATAAILSSNAASNLTDELIHADILIAHEEFLALPSGIISMIDAIGSIVLGSVDSEFAQADPRGYTMWLLRDALTHDSSIVSVWTCWEPNAFDGNDSEFAGAEFHDPTGRFVPVAHWDGGNIAVTSLTDLTGDYCTGAKQTGQPHMTTPYIRDGHEMITYSIPLFLGNRVAGVIGVDISLNAFVTAINDIHILEYGNVYVISSDGLFATHPNSNSVMSHFNTSWLSDFSTEIGDLFRNGGSFIATGFSDTHNAQSLLNASTIELVDSRYVIAAAVPVSAVQADSNSLLRTIIIIGAGILLTIAVIVYFVLRSTLKDLPELTDAAEGLAHGDITVRDLDTGTEPTHNEIVKLERAFHHMHESIKEQAFVLARLAEGDYTTKVNVRGDNDVINRAIDLVQQETLEVLHEVATAGLTVAEGSKQISDGAQTLAQGSTEQASAVQELSASMSEIAQKTKVNTEMANKAAQLAGKIKSNAEKGSGQMSEMMEAVKDINQASHSISKVIKVIDDIAFQTNILALNAAVEAARAGQHGKGFAVVAEEVRNLAAKSAEAAKETGGLITNSIEKAELGSRIASETAASLSEIVSGINESTKLVSDIAVSSEDQYHGIEQISVGVDQVSIVVQANAATAEQSAAASEEMNAQSAMLHDLIEQFNLRTDKRIEGGILP